MQLFSLKGAPDLGGWGVGHSVMSLTEHLVEIKCPKLRFSAHAHKGPGLGYSTSATLHHGNLGPLLCGPLAPGSR